MKMEGSLSSKAYSERSRSYAAALLGNASKELVTTSLPAGKSKFVVLFFHPLVSRCVDLDSQKTTLQGSTYAPMTADKLYIFLVVLFFSHATRLRTRKAIEVLHATNVAVPSYDALWHLQTDMLAYPPTQRADVVDNSGAWSSVTDLTVSMSDFESTSFRIVRQFTVVQMFLHVTLNNELF